MRKLILLVSAAAMAATMPALADAQGQGKGKGRGGESAEVERGRGGPDRAERGRGKDNKSSARARRDDRGKGREARGNRGRANVARAERREAGQERRAERANRNDRRGRELRGRDERPVREARRDRDRDWRGWIERRDGDGRFDRRRRDIRPARAGVGRDGCPPGLAKQNAFCMPPGQLRKARMIGQRARVSDWGRVPERYRYRFSDNDRFLYRFDDGAVYRIARSSGLVNAVTPIFSNGLYIGEPLPLGYEVYNVPLAYRSRYPNTNTYHYRYDDNAIYRTNPQSGLVEGIVALLTGGLGGLGGLGIGDPLPAGYDVYNVPLEYRDRYYDTNDAMYRYADNYVYQVDPETRLIQAAISLLT